MEHRTHKELQSAVAKELIAQGRGRFIATQGVLAVGCSLFLGTTALDWYRHSFRTAALWQNGWLILNLALCLLGGYLYALWRWRRLNRRR
jgi:hypothetical protein